MIVFNSTQCKSLPALQSMLEVVRRNKTEVSGGIFISNGFPEQGGGGSNTDADCDSADTGGECPAVAASDDDDDGGDSDGEPARKTRKGLKNSVLKVGANLRVFTQPLTSNDAGNHMTKVKSGKHRNVTATAGALLIPQTETQSMALLRVNKVLELIPISKSGWWAGVASGRYPKPVKLSARCVAWRAQDIAALIASF